MIAAAGICPLPLSTTPATDAGTSASEVAQALRDVPHRLLALGQVAYSSGLAGRRWQTSNVTFAFMIALVLIVILDIDRPRRGFIQVSQDSMLRLQESLGHAPTR